MKKRDFFKTALITTGALLMPRKIWALEFYPTTPEVEWAIVYSTWCGSSRDAAVWVSEGMNGIADVFDIRENPDLSKYKYLVVGGSIRSGETSKELQEYLARQQSSIKHKIRGLFAVCGNMRQPITQAQYDSFFINHLLPLTGAGPVPLKVFLGRVTFGLMETDVQKMMRSIPGMEEYDNLKRSECMAFGQEILQAMGD